jgi:nitrite reductase (NADH) large subunit
LKDGRLLFADIFLACAGIVPNVQLAKDAGIEVNQGVLVNERMQTSDPNVYAVGDAVEYEGMVHGLWPVAVEQGQVAAINIAGGNASYTPVVPTTMLKVAGIDLMSIGDFEPRSDEDMVILLEDSANDEYRKLLISNGKIIGALMIGFPRLAPIVNEAIKAEVDVTLYMPDLQAGDWEVLKVAMPV